MCMSLHVHDMSLYMHVYVLSLYIYVCVYVYVRLHNAVLSCYADSALLMFM